MTGDVQLDGAARALAGIRWLATWRVPIDPRLVEDARDRILALVVAGQLHPEDAAALVIRLPGERVEA